MSTHEEILASLIKQLREKLEAKGEEETRIVKCLALLVAAANDYHLPNQPEDVLQDLVNPEYY